MKLLIKHITRSIGRRPLQPIILVLTLTMAILVSAVALSLDAMLREEAEVGQVEKYGSADITVSLNADSASRFMFADGAREILGDGIAVVGSYEVPIFVGDERDAVFGVATDVDSIDEIFAIDFIEYRDVYASEISVVAFISSELAALRDIDLGDTLACEVLGEEVTYVVAGISDRALMGSYDVMVDIGGVMRILASDSLILSAIKDGFRPSSTLYIDVRGEYTTDECIDMLAASDSFSDKTVSDISSVIERESYTNELDVLIDMVVILSAILSAAVTYCCFYILSMERSEQNLVLICAGARPWQMALMQFVEVCIYWGIGAIIGSALAFPAVTLTRSYVGLEYASTDCVTVATLTSLGVVLSVALLTVAVFVISSQRRSRRTRRIPRIVCASVSLILCLLAYIVTFSISVKDAMLPGIIAMLLVLLAVFLVSPVLERLILSLISRALDRKAERGRAVSLRYALKNTSSLSLLHNFSRLSALLVAIVVGALFVIVGANGNLALSRSMLSGDYVVTGATDRCYARVAESDEVGRVDKVYFSGLMQGDVYTHALSASSLSALSPEFGLTRLPEGNEAAMSSVQAEYFDLEIGESFSVDIGGKNVTLVLSEMTNSGKSIIIFDCEHFDISPNMLLVSAGEGVSENDLLADLTDRTAVELAIVLSVEDILSDKLSSIDNYLRAGDILIGVIVCFAVLGLFNNLYECYRSRREEFMLYTYAGMSKNVARRMKLFEVIISVVFGIALSVLACVLIILAINRSMNSLAYDGIRNAVSFIGLS